MFTGIIQGKGILVDVINRINLNRFIVKFPNEMLPNLKIGASVSNNGCCLTVSDINQEYITFDLMKETLKLTNLESLKIGDIINLERSVKYSDEIGGHIMSGHIITTAKIIKILKSKNNLQIWFNLCKKKYVKYILHKGFIGIDGISLTVGNVTNNSFCVHLIPETILRTTIAEKNLGEKVNIEIDFHTQAIVDTIERIINKKYKRII
ncbi:Riboflavin synthase [Candidatus Arsenophonus lipoptenae]|uniref:Riboflavin synthase n=1 Tax=Candidatus Arsenophonus lipoptenae TaxID=634113 RepID=A0A0X9WB57_9GAMM|nr:riboflavin synthase [Candidatus Arsenophonus lipoptenae]AMA65138.1 Riboflavin synthase [Candidatus Arsenophonus lipoptenae]